MFSLLNNKSNSKTDNTVQVILIVVVVALVLYYFVNCIRDNRRNNNNNNNNNNNENVTNNNKENVSNQSDQFYNYTNEGIENFENEVNNNIGPSEGVENNEVNAPINDNDVEEEDVTSLPSECYPKEVLDSEDLLPNDSNSTWAQTNPNGQGALTDKNFLSAGFHVGVNTVGQTLRNGNRQLRSDPPNPQTKVSPWMQTTIEPDVNRKPMEIGG